MTKAVILAWDYALKEGSEDKKNSTKLCHVIYYHGDNKYPCLV